MITVHSAAAADLTTAELYAVLRLRVDVFVVEQGAAYPELDGRDLEPATVHLWATGDATGERADDGTPIAYLRVLTEPDGVRRIGRVCTAPVARGAGVARRLMVAALDAIGDAESVLDAQSYLQGFYASFGYVRAGEEHVDVDGIPHVPMRRPGS